MSCNCRIRKPLSFVMSRWRVICEFKRHIHYDRHLSLFMTYIMYNVKEVFLIGRIASMRVTREQVAANREKIVEAASTLFRKHGFDGIGVADIMKAAGLTHGGFYGHFDAKDDLAAEACTRALSREWLKSAAESSEAGGLEAIGKAYL